MGALYLLVNARALLKIVRRLSDLFRVGSLINFDCNIVQKRVHAFLVLLGKLQVLDRRERSLFLFELLQLLFEAWPLALRL